MFYNVSNFSTIFLLNNSTLKLLANNVNSGGNKDDFGALVFTIFIISIYGSLLTLVLFLKVKPYKLEEDDNDKALKIVQKQFQINNNKLLLEQLKNLEYRKKAWQIYKADGVASTSGGYDIEKEKLIIKDIEKKIDLMIRSTQDLNETQSQSQKYSMQNVLSMSSSTLSSISNDTLKSKVFVEQEKLLLNSNKSKKMLLMKKRFENDSKTSNNYYYFTKPELVEYSFSESKQKKCHHQKIAAEFNLKCPSMHPNTIKKEKE